MIYEILLVLITMQSVADDDRSKKPVAKIERKRQDWMIGGWNTKHWGAIRLYEDGYVTDLDPQGDLQNWGIWQNFNGDEDEVLIIWMESSMMEIIQRSGDKYYRQSAYPFGVSSEIIEVKKILKEDK